MFTLIENGEVYGPEPLGVASVLLANSTILKIGDVDRSALDKLDLPVDVVDASGCIVTPGIIDPHQHLLGGSGEEGFSSQTPEISIGEIISAGVIAGGKRLFREGRLEFKEQYLKQSNRVINLVGEG